MMGLKEPLGLVFGNGLKKDGFDKSYAVYEKVLNNV